MAAGVDLAPAALRLAARRASGRLAQATVTELPYAAGTFDVVTSFDVLVMLDPAAEAAALGEMARVLRPGGRLLLRVAAGDWLRGAHDRAWRVRHRYGAGELRAKLARAGLRAELVSHANMWLFPVAAAKRLSERLRPGDERSELFVNFGRLDGLLRRVLASEAPLLARWRLPLGLSLVAVARKPD
jgi:SAM-dependent methyltransferase